MPAYVIADIDITDSKAYEEYRSRVPGTIAQYGGKYIARGGKIDSLEGGWAPKRMAVLEFPSLEQAQKWYRSAEYAPLIKIRQKASRGRVIIVDGV